MFRWLRVALGVLLSLIGIIWILQGINVLGGSFMSGQYFWAGMGVIALAIGIGLLVLRNPR